MRRLSLEIVVGSFNGHGEAEISVRGRTFAGRELGYKRYLTIEHLQNKSIFDLIWREMGEAIVAELEVKP